MTEKRNAKGETLQEFLEGYDDSLYRHPSNTVDMIVMTVEDGQLKILLIRRKDHPWLGDWALPGGFVNFDEDLEQAALRELQEETGYTAGNVRHLVSYYPTCGYSSEFLHIYICKELTAGETHWDATECMDIVEYDADELIDMVMRNEIKDSKTMIALLYARQAGEI